MRVADLTGAQLDYWVAKAEGHQGTIEKSRFMLHTRADGTCLTRNGVQWARHFAPSIDWSHGGPIIAREKLMIEPKLERDGDFYGTWRCVALSFAGRQHADMEGEAPLIAAMRGYVASKFGLEVSD